jgi:peptidoglycan hydrolase-like protein with peptidoglycan-binding domain
MQEPASLKQPETALNQENTAASVSISDKPSLQDIQKALKNAGFYKGEVDGVLGPKTKKAIEDFQAENSLIVDGKVGSKTWGKLKTYLNQN